jgi:hypothetical protein
VSLQIGYGTENFAGDLKLHEYSVSFLENRAVFQTVIGTEI